MQLSGVVHDSRSTADVRPMSLTRPTSGSSTLTPAAVSAGWCGRSTAFGDASTGPTAAGHSTGHIRPCGLGHGSAVDGSPLISSTLTSPYHPHQPQRDCARSPKRCRTSLELPSSGSNKYLDGSSDAPFLCSNLTLFDGPSIASLPRDVSVFSDPSCSYQPHDVLASAAPVKTGAAPVLPGTSKWTTECSPAAMITAAHRSTSMGCGLAAAPCTSHSHVQDAQLPDAAQQPQQRPRGSRWIHFSDNVRLRAEKETQAAGHRG